MYERRSPVLCGCAERQCVCMFCAFESMGAVNETWIYNLVWRLWRRASRGMLPTIATLTILLARLARSSHRMRAYAVHFRHTT